MLKKKNETIGLLKEIKEAKEELRGLLIVHRRKAKEIGVFDLYENLYNNDIYGLNVYDGYTAYIKDDLYLDIFCNRKLLRQREYFGKVRDNNKVVLTFKKNEIVWKVSSEKKEDYKHKITTSLEVAQNRIKKLKDALATEKKKLYGFE